ncbi:MAG: tetratricopeptide repeat protein [Gemmatimonadales bacterium]
MTSGRWEQAAALFEQALELPPEERDQFVSTRCENDGALLERVRGMLRADACGSPLLDATPDDLATAFAVEAPRLEDRRIGPYVVRRILGRGGMGIVCLAEREDVGKQVALKLVAGGLASPERIGRFFRERRVLAQLDHPHIARLLDAGVAEDGTPWLAMDYVAGVTVDRYCAEGPLDLEARLTLFEKICGAVGFAHRHLVVHRDLKPTNILVGKDGEPRLLDFGIAKLLSEAADSGAATETGQGLMTPQYAAPEQIEGRPVTTATDVYQLGALLFELLTGERPRRGRDGGGGGLELAPVLRPSSVGSGPIPARRLQGDLDTIVLKATEMEPGRRYASAERLGDDVRRFREGLPIAARPAAAGYRIRKFIARHRAGTAVAAASVLALVGFALAMAAQSRRTEAERVRAEQVSELLTEIFRNANPVRAQGDTITVRGLLDRGTETIRSNSSIDAVVKARLLGVIAAAYDDLGRLDRTLELQTEVVDLLRGAVPPTHPARLTALRYLGRWLAEADSGERAFAPVDEALVTARTLPRGRREELADILNDAGFTRQRGGKGAAARPYYEEAMAIYRALRDTLDGIVPTLTNLAALAEDRGELDAATGLLREALDRRRAALGPAHSATARIMLTLARSLLRKGQAGEAEGLIRDAIAIQRRVFAAPHPDQVHGFGVLAALLAGQGKYAEAEMAHREGLALARRVYGDSSSAVALTTANLAGHVQRAGRLDEAAELHGEAIRRYRRLLGDGHVSTAVATANLAWTERLRRRFDTSEVLFRRALPVLDSAWRGTPQVSPTLVDFGIVLRLLRKDREAESVFRRAVALGAASWPPTNGDLIRAKRFLGQFLLGLNRFAAAESLLVDAHQSLIAGFGPSNQYVAGSAADLVELYRRWGRPADAARYRSPEKQR